jgi:hypothetical protein
MRLIRPALLRRFGLSIDKHHDILHAPQRRVQARSHRRAAAQRLMLPHEVVPVVVERNHVAVVLSLLGEGVGQLSRRAGRRLALVVFLAGRDSHDFDSGADQIGGGVSRLGDRGASEIKPNAPRHETFVRYLDEVCIRRTC